MNPNERDEGNKMRVYNLLKYFKTRNLQVDFVSIYNHYSKWLNSDLEAFKATGLVNNIHLLYKKPKKTHLVNYVWQYKIPNLIYTKRQNAVKGTISDKTTFFFREQFDDILKDNSYDLVIISYVEWAGLIKNNSYLKNAKTIIDTHDLISSQSQYEKDFDLGKAFGEEIRRLNYFDEVWAISSEEHYLFSQFCRNKVNFVTMMTDEPKIERHDKIFDIIYVASSNQHNQKSSNWFFQQVYPLLSADLKICVIGKISQYIPKETYKNVHLVEFASDLNEYYAKSRIAICPMLSGTGIKVKVIEALSHALPVVCTERGLDGLPNKSRNGCLASNNPEIFARHIFELLNNESFYEEQRFFSREMFRQHFKTEICYERLDHYLQLSEIIL